MWVDTHYDILALYLLAPEHDLYTTLQTRLTSRSHTKRRARHAQGQPRPERTPQARSTSHARQPQDTKQGFVMPSAKPVNERQRVLDLTLGSTL